MLPSDWELKLIDTNVSKLKDEDILWADYVFLSGMDVQIRSFKDILMRCNKLGTKVVAGGPLATTQYSDFLGVSHFVLNEAEITLPQFLTDLGNGNPKYVYKSDVFPDVTNTPIPRWDLLEIDKYASMSLQYSRGCPYDCEFCSITMLNGRVPRTKTKEQFIAELDKLYELGWKGGVSVVDDNFIGNKRRLKNDVLPAVIDWSKKHKYPFHFITEVSINLADDDELLAMMVDAGFYSVFVGIETPNAKGLEECGKSQNLKRDLVSAINKLQNKGMIVSGGFIVGFDSDTEDIFDEQINFIHNSGIPSAMVGILNAPIGTKLFKRLKTENRLLENWSGNNMDSSINFIPKMKYDVLVRGYSRLIHTIYSPKEYYSRIKDFLNVYRLPVWWPNKLTLDEIKAFFRLLWKIGIREKGRKHFWKLFAFSLLKHPKKFPMAMTFSVYGFHFRRIAARL
ncbi:MAG: DUF4070 domain-containing protein [Melioribacteraceae bacterium]|nr:DUF4070 domain-containing protein [Melioribacteraceae bacterium]